MVLGSILGLNMKLSDLIAQESSLRAKADLAGKAKARAGLHAVAELLVEAGLVSGSIRFREDADESNLYDLVVEVEQPADGLSETETEDKFREAISLRDFADDLTNAGYGEFFQLEICFATFRADFVGQLDSELKAAGVEIA